MCSHWTRRRTSARERPRARPRARFSKDRAMAESAKGEKERAMRIDPALVRELAELLTENQLTEIEVEDGARRVKVRREPAPLLAAAPAAAAASAPVAAPAAQPAAAEATPRQLSRGAATAPLAGTAVLS